MSKSRGEHRHVLTNTIGTIKDEDPQVSWGVVSDGVGTSDGLVYTTSKEGMDSSPGFLLILGFGSLQVAVSKTNFLLGEQALSPAVPLHPDLLLLSRVGTARLRQSPALLCSSPNAPRVLPGTLGVMLLPGNLFLNLFSA